MSEGRTVEQYPSTASALSLVAGILIVIGAAFVTFWAYAWAPYWGGMMGNWRGMMGGMMGSPGFGFGPMSIFGGMAILGLVSGIIVLISAILLRNRPAEHNTWGVLILVFSILSFLGMGGFLVGGIIGIVGGALALSWNVRT